VTFVYTGSRDGSILGRVLEGFRGVLVSDFYAAYDSVPCAQQKCLVHLIRDMNDDLFRNQLDADLRDLVQIFSGVLKPIILTIDEHGLKRRQLRKHKESVEEFLDDLAVREYRRPRLRPRAASVSTTPSLCGSLSRRLHCGVLNLQRRVTKTWAQGSDASAFHAVSDIRGLVAARAPGRPFWSHGLHQTGIILVRGPRRP